MSKIRENAAARLIGGWAAVLDPSSGGTQDDVAAILKGKLNDGTPDFVRMEIYGYYSGVDLVDRQLRRA